jgi:hypothetical protein
VLFRSGRRDEAIRVMEELIVEDEDRSDYYRRRKAYFEEAG